LVLCFIFYILYFFLLHLNTEHATLQLSPKLILLSFKGWLKNKKKQKKGLQVAALVKIKLLLGLTRYTGTSLVHMELLSL
jgi:hypothetical protein